MTLKTLFSSGKILDFESKINHLKSIFLKTQKPEEKYHLLITLGKDLEPCKAIDCTPDALVQGCQSRLYLSLEKDSENRLFFFASTDALISKGLVALLIYAYQGETVETLLKTPPLFIQDLGLNTTLSMNRSQGIYYIYLKMRELAIKQ